MALSYSWPELGPDGPTRIVVVRAADGSRLDGSARDRLSARSPRSTFTVHDCPGDHTTVLSGTNGEQVADILRAVIGAS